MTRMKLLTKDVLDRLPELYSQEHTPDPIVQVKFFTPDSSWSWYVTEGSLVDENNVVCAGDARPADFLMFGLVVGQFTELGYVSYMELSNARGPLGLWVERDLHFTPQPLSQIKEKIKERGYA